jgi:hypothetical protein
MKIIVGHTGFVGSNLLENTNFDFCFNSKNINDAFGLNPNLVVYSGVRAEKFLANKNPENDFNIILNAIENIKKINPKKIVLISSIDVYPTPEKRNEDFVIDISSQEAYGKNRLYLENWVEQNIENHLIIRLPALFGSNLKKNFIFDLIQVVPAMLNQDLYQKYASNSFITKNYELQENGFYKLIELTKTEKEILKTQFLNLGFSALNFTDSRGVFQFYNLKNLWQHIEICFKNNIKKINLVTEPLSASEIYFSIYNSNFENEVANIPPLYNCLTKHAAVFSNLDNYIQTKQSVLLEIKEFIIQQTN